MSKLESELNDVFEPVLNLLRAALIARMNGYLISAFIQADRDVVDWAAKQPEFIVIYKESMQEATPKVDINTVIYEGPPIEEAISWAEKHCATLVTDMDNETKRRLAKVVSDGIENKRGIPGLGRDIRKTFDDMTKYRSELIAKTETRNALWKGSRERMVKMRVTGKEWILGSGGASGNCDDCIANAAQGVIPIDQDFRTPEDQIHPGCTCDISPAMM